MIYMLLQYNVTEPYIILIKIFFGIEKVTYIKLYMIRICFQGRKEYKNINLFTYYIFTMLATIEML